MQKLPEVPNGNIHSCSHWLAAVIKALESTIIHSTLMNHQNSLSGGGLTVGSSLVLLLPVLSREAFCPPTPKHGYVDDFLELHGSDAPMRICLRQFYLRCLLQRSPSWEL